MRRMTPKQERFCQLYVQIGNASEAYRQSYDCSRMKSETIHRCAHELLQNPKITARIQEIVAESDYTVDRFKKSVIEIAETTKDDRLKLACHKELSDKLLRSDLGLDRQATDITVTNSAQHRILDLLDSVPEDVLLRAYETGDYSEIPAPIMLALNAGEADAND